MKNKVGHLLALALILIGVVPTQAAPPSFVSSAGGIGETGTYAGNKTITGTLGVGGEISAGQTLGDEMVIDGGFTDTANWTEGDGWAIVGGVMVHTAGVGTLAPAVALAPVVGTLYKVSYTVSAWTVAGTSVTFGGVIFQPDTKPAADGTLTAYVTAITTGTLIFTPVTGGRFSIDNVSIKPVTSKLAGSPGPLVISDTLSDVGSEENALILNAHKTTNGNKAALRINTTYSGAIGTDRRDFIDGWDSFVGGRTFFVTSVGGLWAKSSVAVGGTADVPYGTFGPYGTSMRFTGFPGDEGIMLFSYYGDNALNRGWIFAPFEAGTEQTASNVVQDYVQIKAELKQTGTAGSNALAVRISETTLGSGAQNLIYASTYAANDANPFAGTETVRFAVSNKGLISYSSSVAITADAGSAQGGSPLTTTFNVITVVATAGDSVTLPSVSAGLHVWITNRDAADAADVFPASGDDINAVGVNTAKALPVGTSLECWGMDTTNWECVTHAR